MDAQALWSTTCEILKKEINITVYQTLIERPLTAHAIEGDTLILIVSAAVLQPIITSKYQSPIDRAVSAAANRTMHTRILTNDQLKEYEAGHRPPAAPIAGVTLNPKYTFDTFVVGAGNELAYAASVAVANAPAEAYNPLFIYGGVGLGKTHLMHAIGHFIQENYPEKRIQYITSEAFTNDLIHAISEGKNTEFRDRFRNVDVLMVDDIQFIAGRTATQDEFFHTFNALHDAKKQIILTSDKPPQEISRLEERLSSRFAWGMIADIQKPDIETRTAILRKKAQMERLQVPDEVFSIIAEGVDSNIRELEGSLTRLSAYADLMKAPITADMCRVALRDVLGAQRRTVTVDVIISNVCRYFAITQEDLIGPTRRRDIVVPRQIAIFLTRDMIHLSLPQIGQAFGNRDHSTVLHSIGTIAQGIETTPQLAAQVRDIRQMIQES